MCRNGIKGGDTEKEEVSVWIWLAMGVVRIAVGFLVGWLVGIRD